MEYYYDGESLINFCQNVLNVKKGKNVMFLLNKDFKVSNQIAHIQMENMKTFAKMWQLFANRDDNLTCLFCRNLCWDDENLLACSDFCFTCEALPEDCVFCAEDSYYHQNS
jgi:hypothetical protein